VVAVDGSNVEVGSEPRQTWAIHKPRGMVTTLSDPQGRPTVKGLVSDLPIRLYPVGRLDWDAEGLLLMSNDGDLTPRLTHPSFGIPRVYRALVMGQLLPATVDKLRGEVQLEDGPVQVLAVEGESGERRSTLTLTVAEGRNHLVKRLCDAVGHEVERLFRLSYGGIELGDLPPRGRRQLSRAEVASL
jgi:23S rRNA pseudouridine2605 synthase